METITRKSMLYKTKVDYQLDANGEPVNDYAMNHVLGCPHGCKYPCYAMNNALRFKQVESYKDWCRPKIVINALDLLERELASKKNVHRVHLCFTTDPFPHIGEGDADAAQKAYIHELSYMAIQIINAHYIPVTVLTKGTLPVPLMADGVVQLRPAHTLAKDWNIVNPDNYYGISLISLNERFREEWEPHTAPYAERIASLKALHDAGCKTWVSMEPFPALTSRGHWELYGLLYDRPEEADTPSGDEQLASAVGAVSSDLPRRYDRAEKPIWYDGAERRDARMGRTRAQDFGALTDCLRRVAFVDRIVFGRWNYNKDMPADVEDVDAWYHGAAEVVRRFCAERGIECVIKGGID